MQYSEILNSLYHGTIEDVVHVLNMSIYSTNLNIENELFIIHTGFSFTTQNEKEMEIMAGFYQSSNKILLICQPRAYWSYRWIPSYNGMVIKMPEQNCFLNQIDNKICKKIEETDNDYNLYYVEYKNSDEIFSLTYDIANDFFTIIKDQHTIEFHLNKKLQNPVYSNGSYFSATPFSQSHTDDEDSENDEY